METPRGSDVLPLRPLTIGELLDAAVGLLRGNAAPLLTVAFLLATAEQAILYPLRELAEVSFPEQLMPYDDLLPQYWLMICVGYLTEATIIALLGGLAARTAVAAVTGRPLTSRALLSPRGSRLGAVVLVALIVGVLCGVAPLACWVPWILPYATLGLAVPALMIDGRGPFSAIWRSLALSFRGGLRVCWVRLIGYLGWLAIRIALGIGGVAALSLVLPASDRLLTIIGMGVLALVNTVAYATLACLDAALHVEARMRTEGLDIVAFRARRQGQPIPLAVPR